MISYETIELALMQPNVVHVHHNSTTGQWDAYAYGEPLPFPTLAERRAALWNAIKAQRDFVSDNGGYGVVIAGAVKWFHSDPRSKTQQLGLARKADRIQAAGGDMAAQFPGDSGFWKTMDGSFVAMTGNIAHAIADAAERQDGAIFHAAETHRAQILLSADPDSYDFSAGWPESYGG